MRRPRDEDGTPVAHNDDELYVFGEVPRPLVRVARQTHSRPAWRHRAHPEQRVGPGTRPHSTLGVMSVNQRFSRRLTCRPTPTPLVHVPRKHSGRGAERLNRLRSSGPLNWPRDPTHTKNQGVSPSSPSWNGFALPFPCLGPDRDGRSLPPRGPPRPRDVEGALLPLSSVLQTVTYDLSLAVSFGFGVSICGERRRRRRSQYP